MIKLYEIVMTS